jgi:hypothetical protein
MMMEKKHTPRVIDNDRNEITVALDGKEIRGWSYDSEAERRAKMTAAREFVEGWYQAERRVRNLYDFAASWVRLVEATTAPVNVDAALNELGDDHKLTLTVAQFRELYQAARAAIAAAEAGQ